MSFVPAGRFMLLGYPLTATACLDCGFVAAKLDRSDVSAIKDKRANP